MRLLMVLRTILVFPSAWELWMAHPMSVQLITTIIKVGTTSSCKKLLTIGGILQTSTLQTYPGRVHDARVFANSSLYQKGQSGNLFLIGQNRLLEKRYHYFYLMTLHILLNIG